MPSAYTHNENNRTSSGAVITPNISAKDWKPLNKGALRGFVTLCLPLGIELADSMLLESNGKRWINLPGKLQLERDGQIKRDANGKPSYSQFIAFNSKAARDAFQDAALAAVDRLLSHDSTPPEVEDDRRW